MKRVILFLFGISLVLGNTALATAGTSVTFVDNTTPGVPVLYAGTANQQWGGDEYVLVGETSPGTLLTGGTITVTLSSGALFQASYDIPTANYTDATYLSTDFSIANGPYTSSTDTFTFPLVASSSTSLGAFTIGMNQTVWLDLTNATPGDLTMTFSGTAGVTGTVQIATIEPSSNYGTTVSFIDDATPGVPELYAGTDNQELGPNEYILVGEMVPGVLLQGGTITIELSNSAEFQASSTIPVDNYTDATYQSTTFSVSAAFISSTGISMTVTGSSSAAQGAFTVGMNGTDWLDLTNATPGDLTMTLGGTAGATGTVTIATILDPNASTTWYYDSDGDGYGDPNVSITSTTQPADYVSDNTDCDDTDAGVNPGASETAGDGVDNDCDGTVDNTGTGSSTISLLAPSNNEAVSYGSAGGKVLFSFSKVTDAAKYILNLKLNDILTNVSLDIPVELIPAGTTSGSPWGGNTSTGTPGFSEQFIGMVYELALDSATWDILALYDIDWGVEAYDSTGSLIGSTAGKYEYALKFMASNSITMTTPSNGAALNQTDDAPSFQWETYTGVGTYTMILAHVGSLGFDNVIVQENLTLNLFPMDDPTWQTMPTGGWYWTVLGYDASGAQTPGGFTLFDFEVQ